MRLKRARVKKACVRRQLMGLFSRSFVFGKVENGEEARAGLRTSTKTAISSRTRAGVGRKNSCSKAILVRPEEFL